ncbi:hypothetical protein L873DRAFT_1909594 [Choiromyces venosus 120613-1]|uniref:Uncharacterized protein n=1 Tax=Choiromyces venosus 120613-1 TaxID=1336337 RepID=A0A3N4KA58_9PEZI|nr:hypothetical protein L873DRAFT_1909594 [Choiromyces venosus 120613-1]
MPTFQQHLPHYPGLSNGASHILLASVPAKLQAAMEMVFTSEFLLSLKTDLSMARYSLMPIRHVPESLQCQPSNATSHVLLMAVTAELQATMQIVFAGKFLLILKTDISTPRHLLMPIRYAPGSTRCQRSNDTSHILLALVSTELQAAMKWSLLPSNSASQNLLARVPTKLQAAIKLVFIGEFLLSLKKDILIPRQPLTPIRHILESPQCQPSNGTSYILLGSAPTELQAIIKMVFNGEFLLSLKTDTSTPKHSLTPLRHVSEPPQCLPSSSTSYILLASVLTRLQAAMEMFFTCEYPLNTKTDISMPRSLPLPIRYILESP